MVNTKRIAQLFMLGLLACFVVSLISSETKELSDDEMLAVKGAGCRVCPSETNKTCTTGGSCSGVICQQNMINGFPVSCVLHSGGSRGCSSGGSYKRCVWQWGGPGCSNDQEACGKYRYPYCNRDGAWCTGTCTVKSAGTCKWGC